MKKYIARLVAVSTVVLIPGLAVAADFPDVPASHPNAEAIAYVQAQGIVTGYPDGSYRPDLQINRAEFTKIVIGSNFTDRALQFCVDFGFSDTSRTEWYAKYICLAAQHQIIAGYPDGTFRPDTSINFVEAAKIIATMDNFYVNGVGYNNTPSQFGILGPPLPEAVDGHWFESFVRYLAEKNAIPLSIHSPNKQITRGEMAEMIYRLQTNVTNKPSRTYEELVSGVESSAPQYRLLPLSSQTINNYARNIVYRYAITAPSTQAAVITSQTFSIRGGRWQGPQLRIYDQPSFTNQIDTWASDDNWTASDTAILRGNLTIPAGQTRYVDLTVDIGTPADMGFSVEVKHESLGSVLLSGAASGRLYNNEQFGFAVTQPSGWDLYQETNSSASFGQSKNFSTHGYDGEWFIAVFDAAKYGKEDYIQTMGDQFTDRREQREQVTINGRAATKVTVTTPSVADWVYQAILIEGNLQHEKFLYVVHNGAIPNELFNAFYETFRLDNKISDPSCGCWDGGNGVCAPQHACF